MNSLSYLIWFCFVLNEDILYRLFYAFTDLTEIEKYNYITCVHNEK